MTKRPVSVRLELESRPESVTLVRAMVSGIADGRALGPEVMNDLKTVVSEACNNVVVHAYDGEPGPMSVTIALAADGVTATVRDRGAGFHAVAARDDGMGVGLAVISALAARAEFATPPDGGTEVRMWLPAAGAAERPLAHTIDRVHAREFAGEAETPWRDDLDNVPARPLPGDVRVTLSPVALLAPVLGRLARAAAAASHFSVDRFSDVYLVADALGAHARRAATADRISFSIASASKRLRLAVGPLNDGSAARLQPEQGALEPDSPLSLLADELRIERDELAETMHVVLYDGAARPPQRPAH